MKIYVNKKTYKKLLPIEQLKRSYCVIKRHKPNHPCRAIVSSINSVTSGCEAYLIDILGKLNNICTLSIDSTKNFKSIFASNKNKFNQNDHDISTIDAQNLYPNVNLTKVINFILEKIYENPSYYFGNTDDENNPTIGIPPQKIFEKFLKSILIEFNCFSSLNGYYRQTSGCSMGSRLSPVLGNIYLYLMEKSIVEDEMKKGNIIQYYRYVDDILLSTKKVKKFYNTTSQQFRSRPFTIYTSTNDRK